SISVCEVTQTDIDRAIAIASLEGVIMTTFGDMMRVPGTCGSFNKAKENGADIRVVYSPLDTLSIAEDNPNKRVVFMGVGFETTAPTIAATVLEAKKMGLKNIFFLSNFKLVFPALSVLLNSDKVNIDGFICPGHVSVITGIGPYEPIAKKHKKPCVIMGFDAEDILRGIRRLIEKARDKSYNVEIEYKRVVTKAGNAKARRVLSEVFSACDSEWRGVGEIPRSGLRLRKEFRDFDSQREFSIKIPKSKPPKGCLCGNVLQGISSPRDCKLFGKACTPLKPIGPCMVSSEGTCAAFYKYKV
ncbi:hydrogenase formation protein HypD, partial [Candidatus Omnitrophota bacterium]